MQSQEFSPRTPKEYSSSGEGYSFTISGNYRWNDQYECFDSISEDEDEQIQLYPCTTDEKKYEFIELDEIRFKSSLEREIISESDQETKCESESITSSPTQDQNYISDEINMSLFEPEQHRMIKLIVEKIKEEVLKDVSKEISEMKVMIKELNEQLRIERESKIKKAESSKARRFKERYDRDQDFREEIKSKSREKIPCQFCKKEVSKGNLWKHQNTLRCKMSKKNSEIEKIID